MWGDDEKTQAAAGPGTVSSHFPTVRLFAETKTERPKCKQYDNIRRKTFVLCGTCSLRAGYQWRNAVICQSDGGSSARMRTHPVTSAESNRRPHSDAHLVPRLLFPPPSSSSSSIAGRTQEETAGNETLMNKVELRCWNNMQTCIFEVCEKKPEWLSQYVARRQIKVSDMTAGLVFTLIQNIFIPPAGRGGPRSKSGGLRKSAETSESRTQLFPRSQRHFDWQVKRLEGPQTPNELVCYWLVILDKWCIYGPGRI